MDSFSDPCVDYNFITAVSITWEPDGSIRHRALHSVASKGPRSPLFFLQKIYHQV